MWKIEVSETSKFGPNKSKKKCEPQSWIIFPESNFTLTISPQTTFDSKGPEHETEIFNICVPPTLSMEELLSQHKYNNLNLTNKSTNCNNNNKFKNPKSKKKGSLVYYHRRKLELARNEWYFPRSLNDILIKSILSLIIMQPKLCLLISMIMMLSQTRLPKPKNTNFITNTQSQHHSLHTRRVMKISTIPSHPPIIQRLPRLLRETLQRIILHNPPTQRIKPRVRDNQSRLVRRITHGVIHEMHRLTNVHNDWDIDPIRVTKTPFSPSTKMQNVAIYKRNTGLRPHIALEPSRSSIVQSHDEFVAINQLPKLTLQQNPTIAHDRTRRVALAIVS